MKKKSFGWPLWCGLGAFVAAIPFAYPVVASWEYLETSLPSAFNGTVRVTRSVGGYRFLRFEDSAIQSAMAIKNPSAIVLAHARGMRQAMGECWASPQSYLFVGVGGGTLPVDVHARCKLASIDAVDIDVAVLALARSHFGFVDDARLQGHVADGAAFVRESKTKYDVVVLDAFNGFDAPEHLQSAEFLTAVKKTMTLDGVMVVNLLAPEMNPGYEAFLSRLRSVFSSVEVLPVDGAPFNRVVRARS